MKNERYTVRLTGHVRTGFSEQQVLRALRDQIHGELTDTELLFDGNNKDVGTDLVLNKARQLQQKMLLAGANADIQVMLTSKTLQESTFSTKNKCSIAPTKICIVSCAQCGRRQLEAECCEDCGQAIHPRAGTNEPQPAGPVVQTLRFRSGHLVPFLFSLAHREPLQEKGKPVYGYVCSLRAVLSIQAAAVFSLALGFVVQWSFLFFYARNISTGIEGTIFSIALLVGILLVFPGWIHPARRYTFQPARATDPTLFWSQKKSWLPSLTICYHITDAHGAFLGRMERALLGHKAYLYSAQGTLLYRVKNEQTMDDAVAAAAYAIGERLAGSIALDMIVWFFGEPGRNVIMVRDASGYPVAEIKPGATCRILRFAVPKEGKEGALLPFLLLQSKM